MALRIVKKVIESNLRSQILRSSTPRSYSLYEPDYLETGKSKIPLHDVLNIRLKGYDYPVLESYQGLVHDLADHLGIEVETGWATPMTEFQIRRFKPKSTVVAAEYKLKTYYRTVQIANPTSIQYPLLLRLIEASLPEGVTVEVVTHDPKIEEDRYVPDKELVDLRSKLDEYGKPKTTKK
ncbi:30S ribosomal protein S10 [Athalia rosae]|uniref:30S ribosomal protein S10 n=1 Tax=Athalia rosae TaxID=37344 RepID=UPI0020335FD6|nr:30S ribosomal protein S10 [Athalia rosae]